MRHLHGADRQRAVYACTREIGSVAGRSVTTIEGLGTAANPHPLQQAFLEEQAGQCGYCLSGIIISAKALLDRNPDAIPSGYRSRAGQASVPLRHPHPDHRRRPESRRHGKHRSMSDTLPLSIQNNRRMEKWLRFQPDRTVKLAVGKVEIGQGVLIALSQIAAEELDVAIDRIDILSGDTADAPDEGSTSSSQSIEVSGRSVRLISAELRTRVVNRLAQRLNCAPEELSIEDGVFLQDGNPTGHDYWSFSGPGDFAADIDGSAQPKAPAAYKVVGQPVPRRDLIAKVTGAAFIHDIVRPDMLHARVLRQPSRDARLQALNEAAIRKAAGGAIRIVRVGDFVAFVGPDETAVQRAAVAAPAHAQWTGVRTLRPEQQEAAWFRGQPSDDRHIGDPAPPTQSRRGRQRNLFPPVRRACRAGTVMRAGGIPRRASVGLVAHPGRLSAAQQPRPTSWACRATRSPSGTPTAPAATAITAPTMPPWMPRSSPCRSRITASACSGGARKNSASNPSAPRI